VKTVELNREQKKAVETTEGPLLIIAGAGSGKTRVLVERIVHILETKRAHPSEILAVTFTNKAANEMKERIAKHIGFQEANRLFMSTFHSMCVRILRRNAHLITDYHENFNQRFTICDTKDTENVMKEILQDRFGLDTKKVTPREILGYISTLKNEMIDLKTARFKKPSHNLIDWKRAADVLAYQIPKDKKELVIEAYTHYQQQLYANNAMDFDDLILATIHLFQQHEKVLKYYQRKFRYILVDEYQDTNHCQYVLNKLLAFEHRNLCVVGDDSQSIYRFRGADIRNILYFEKDYPEVTTVMLEENYRCGPFILQAANQVISNNKQQKKKNLYTSKKDGEKIRYYCAINQYDEARFVTEAIQDIKWKEPSYTYNDFAILFRTNSQSRSFEEAFMRSSIPYQVIGGLKFFQRAEIKDIISYLQFLYNPADAISFKRIVNVPRRGIGAKTEKQIVAHSEGMTILEGIKTYPFKGKAKVSMESFVNTIESLRAKLDEMPIGDLLSELLNETGYLTMLKESSDPRAEERIENVSELINIAIDQQNQRNATLEEFLEHVSLHSDIDDSTNDNSVKLMTMHSAKGLEFKTVFLPGMEEGIFPHQRSLNEGDVEEERRLAYVGITRAEKYLYMLHARFRQQWGKEEANDPSRFLYEFDENLLDPTYPLVKI